MHIQDSVRFFIGANTPQGFYGFHQTDLYDPRDGWVAFLIKSGAGTGKATFMRQVMHTALDKGLRCEAICCSSDPDSLDAVRFPDEKLCIVDATAPHTLEPIAYGECEQLVPFGCCLRSELTERTDEWFAAADATAAGHARCCRLMSAAAGLLENNRRLQESSLRFDKITAAARRLAEKECGSKARTQGRELRRFLSAVTPQGHLFFEDTVTALCPRLYAVEDEYGAASAAFMARLREELLDRGQELITCPCPLSPLTKIDHLLLPALGTAFVSSNSYHRLSGPVYRRIHAARFTESGVLSQKKQQLRFNRRAASELLAEAVNHITDAKEHHDRMEARHIAAMDWARWRCLADEASERFFAFVDARRSQDGG